MSKRIFELEDLIMKCWTAVMDDIELLMDQSESIDMPAADMDRLFSALIGMSQMHDWRFQRLFDKYEELIPVTADVVAGKTREPFSFDDLLAAALPKRDLSLDAGLDDELQDYYVDMRGYADDDGEDTEEVDMDVEDDEEISNQDESDDRTIFLGTLSVGVLEGLVSVLSKRQDELIKKTLTGPEGISSLLSAEIAEVSHLLNSVNAELKEAKEELEDDFTCA